MVAFFHSVLVFWQYHISWDCAKKNHLEEDHLEKDLLEEDNLVPGSRRFQTISVEISYDTHEVSRLLEEAIRNFRKLRRNHEEPPRSELSTTFISNSWIFHWNCLKSLKIVIGSIWNLHRNRMEPPLQKSCEISSKIYWNLLRHNRLEQPSLAASEFSK